LLSIHNLHVLIDLSATLRKEILEGSFQAFLNDFLSKSEEIGVHL
jgi:queuine/archaeosine tRNA-ribosyltransferase